MINFVLNLCILVQNFSTLKDQFMKYEPENVNKIIDLNVKVLYFLKLMCCISL